MDRGVPLLAGVAHLRLDDFTKRRVALHRLLRELQRRENVRRCEHGLPAQLANAAGRKHTFFRTHFRGSLDNPRKLDHAAPVDGLRPRHAPGGHGQPRAILDGHPDEEFAVCDDLFEKFRGGADALEERVADVSHLMGCSCRPPPTSPRASAPAPTSHSHPAPSGPRRPSRR